MKHLSHAEIEANLRQDNAWSLGGVMFGNRVLQCNAMKLPTVKELNESRRGEAIRRDMRTLIEA